MNARLLPVLIPLVLVFGAGCSSDVCDRIAKSHTALVAKTTACGLDQGTFDVNACKANEKSCSGGEVDAYNKYYDCLDNLPACTSGGNVYASQEKQCAMGATATQACNQALAVH